jgi:phosphatidylserine decarboxylase
MVVIDSPIGLVACIPMGMAQVSSVVITAEVGKALHKGEELGYFQFGGSDFILIFERASNMQLITKQNVHYNQGSWIGNAHPNTLNKSS